MKIYDYLTNDFHNPMKDQVLLHAVCNIIGIGYEPILQGISADNISLRICNVFFRYGVSRRGTGDIGTCSIMMQELIQFLLSKGIITEARLHAQIQEVWERLYREEYGPML